MTTGSTTPSNQDLYRLRDQIYRRQALIAYKETTKEDREKFQAERLDLKEKLALLVNSSEPRPAHDEQENDI